MDEFVVFGEIEIGHALLVGAKICAIRFIGGETLERNQRERNIVGALMRHPVADEIAAAFRNDAQPAPGVLLEHRALERIELVADENGDGQGNLRGYLPSLRAKRSNPRPQGRLDCFVASLLAMTNEKTLSRDNSHLTTLMLRLPSNYESRPRHRHGRRIGRRSRALQHADGADDRPRADRQRTGAPGRRHPADREFASFQAGGRRPGGTGEAGPPPLLSPHRPRRRWRAGGACGSCGARRSHARAHRAEGSGAAPGADLLRSSGGRPRRADAWAPHTNTDKERAAERGR